MNEQLEETLNSILTKSIELAEKSGRFVIEQGGDLLQEFYLWHTTRHVLEMLLGVSLILLARVFYVLLTDKTRDEAEAKEQYSAEWEHAIDSLKFVKEKLRLLNYLLNSSSNCG